MRFYIGKRIGFAIAAVVAGWVPAAFAGRVTDLGPAGGDSFGNAINSSGEAVGWANDNTTDWAYLYSGGTSQNLGFHGAPLSINNSGTVVGATGHGAFEYANGVETELSVLGADARAEAINRNGDVTGTYVTGGYNQAFILSGGIVTTIPPVSFPPNPFLSGGNYASGYGINNNGDVVGTALYAGDHRAFVYSGGSLVLFDLGTNGAAINDSGQVAGTRLVSNTQIAFLYSGGMVQDLGALGSGSSYAEGINSTGMVVGQSVTASGATRAFLYAGNGMVDLNSFVPDNSGWVLTDARQINDLGQVVGTGYYNGYRHGYILDTATPEPGTISLLAAGALGLLLARRRMRQA